MALTTETINPFLRHLTKSGRREFAWRAAMVAALFAAAALLWYTAAVFLIAFAGILLAVLLDFLACRLAAFAGIRRGWAFAIAATGISLLLALACWEAIPRVADQISQLIRSLPYAFEQFRSYLEGRQWGRTALGYLPNILASADITAKITALARGAFRGLAALTVIVVVGLYLGGSPSLYERGLLKLFPEEYRDRARDTLSEVAYTLRWWLVGQLIPMAILGTASMLGLWLLHVRLAFTLGLFTGFMVFIPYIGSVIALIVTVLVTTMQGPTTVLYVMLFFLGIHLAEGYLLTPMVQKRAVYLPPGLTILSQILMGVLFGFLGLALATPLTAAALVLVKILYLHERPAHH